MPKAPHLNPLPWLKGRGGSTRTAYVRGLPQDCLTDLRTRRVSKVVICLWILAVAARLILINQPYVDHWSWRQSDVAAIARYFSEGGFHFGYPFSLRSRASSWRGLFWIWLWRWSPTAVSEKASALTERRYSYNSLSLRLSPYCRRLPGTGMRIKSRNDFIRIIFSARAVCE